MPRDAFEEAVAAAIDGTSNEIFDSAFGKEESVLDETGDRTLETVGEGLEGQIEPEEPDEEAGEEEEVGEEEEQAEGEEEGEQPKAAKPEAETEPQGRVPSGRLREARARATALEMERDELRRKLDETQGDSRKQIEALNARFDSVVAAMRNGQAQPKPDKAADAPKLDELLFEKPGEFVSQLDKRMADQVAPILQEIRNNRVATSLELAHARHGELFVRAQQAIGALDPSRPENQRLVSDLYNAPNPGEAFVAWQRRNETLREVGDDPAKYKERIANEARESLMKDPDFRKQLLAQLRTEAEGNGNGRPNTITKLPPSLNGARGGGREAIDPSVLDDSQQGIFESAFATRSRA